MKHETTGNGTAGPAPHFTALAGGFATHFQETGSELSVRFERGAAAASAARNALMALEPKLDPGMLEDIRLLVSELVTNAIRHAGSPSGGEVGVDVSILHERVRVEVADPGPGFEPQPRDSAMTKPGGWGLYLVDRLADRWGVTRNRVNRVWFELDVDVA
jgi:anti-sigma regulatory factor (Ser/Thr protein kinase)